MSCGGGYQSLNKAVKPSTRETDSSACGMIVDAYKKYDFKKGYQGSTKAMAEEFTESHNYVRDLYGLSNMKWDEEIARYAQEWADYLKNNNNCRMAHRSMKGRKDGKEWGENLAWFSVTPGFPSALFSGSPKAAVLGWSAECRDYSYEQNTCQPGKKCGHFTQVAWESSARFGCGRSFCQFGDHQEELWVCNYDPPGNYIGQRPF